MAPDVLNGRLRPRGLWAVLCCADQSLESQASVPYQKNVFVDLRISRVGIPTELSCEREGRSGKNNNENEVA